MLTLLLGGTFDPVHEGHLALARTAARAFDACVRLLPSRQPPHRGAPQASAGQRLAMLQLAIAGQAQLAVDTRELERDGPSYMVDTLHGLRAELGAAAPIGLILGADAFLGLPGWHRWEQILVLAHLVVVTRPGSRLDDLPRALEAACAGRWTSRRALLQAQPAGHVHQLPMTPHPASATAIREALGRGDPHPGGLPEPVLRYIAQQRLYGFGSAPASPP